MRTVGKCLATIFALAVMSGCNGQPQLTPRAKALLQAGKDAYGRGDDKAVVSRMGAFLAEHGGSSSADQAHYYRGRAKRRLGDTDGAAADLAEALTLTGDVGLRTGAAIVLGDIAYEAGKMVLAEQRYRLALRDVPERTDQHEHVLFRLGSALQRQGKWTRADGRFDRQIYLFPKSRLSALARRKVRAVAWTVMAGIYRDRADADRAAAKLREGKLAPQVRPVRRDGQLLFVVQVGRHRTYEPAAAALGKVKAVYPVALVTVTR